MDNGIEKPDGVVDRRRAPRAVSTWRVLRAGLATVVLLAGAFAYPYDRTVHQQLTFIAARHFNECVADSATPRLTPLQVRYIARANAQQAEGGFWRRVFRWNYYDRSGESDGRMLWIFETRLHNQYANALTNLNTSASMADQFSNLGRVVNFLQDATTPASVVPVYTARWWRFSMSDRFNQYPVNVDFLESALRGNCVALRVADTTYDRLLESTAEKTITSVLEPIEGHPASWESFWRFSRDAKSFGSYGVAGNSFGRATEFNCGDSRCGLADADPVYRAYADRRHLDAVLATMTAMAMAQTRIQNQFFRADPDAD